MKYDELLKILRECNDCICEEHCPYYEERNNPLRCMTKIVGDAADAIEKLLGIIQRQKETINATAYLPLYQKPKWIPVSERLPEKYEFVLVCSKVVKMRTDFIKDNGKWYNTPCVTHWMPLPEPPKEETDG